MSLPQTPAGPDSGFTYGVTSSLGYLREQVPRLSVIIFTGALAVSRTSSAEPWRLWDYSYAQGVESTASSAPWSFEVGASAFREETVEVARRAVTELRRRSGLTWKQLAQVLDVSRRSVHFWASGKPMNAENEAHLFRVLDIVRGIDRGSASATRAALLQPQDQVTPFDLLITGHYAEARKLLGQELAARRPQVPRTPLDARARALRTPLRPEELAVALDDSVRLKARTSRGVRTSRTDYGEGD